MDIKNAVEVFGRVANPNKSICGSLGKGKKFFLKEKILHEHTELQREVARLEECLHALVDETNRKDSEMARKDCILERIRNLLNSANESDISPEYKEKILWVIEFAQHLAYSDKPWEAVPPKDIENCAGFTYRKKNEDGTAWIPASEGDLEAEPYPYHCYAFKYMGEYPACTKSGRCMRTDNWEIPIWWSALEGD